MSTLKPKMRICILAVCVAGLLAQPFTAAAAYCYWMNTSGGTFSDGANWSGGVAPTSADTAWFTSNATYTVTFTANTNTTQAIFDASTAGNVTVDLGGYAWTNSGIATVGNTTSGNSLTVQNGGTLYGYYVYVGNNATSNNTLTVLNGTVSASDELKVSPAVGGHHNRLVVNGSNAACRLTRYDAFIGYDGYANSMLVTNGGKVSAPRSFNIGWSATSSNNQGVVTGAGSLLDPGILRVGNLGANNSLTLQDGALALGNTGYVGTGAGANGNSMLISGASWTNNGTIYVGFNGAHGNTLTLTNGAVAYGPGYGMVGYLNASSNSLIVADGTLTVGQRFVLGYKSNDNTALVSGPNAVLRGLSWDLNVGYHPDDGGAVGTGNRLTVRNGGLVASGRDVTVGGAGGSNTILVADGGVLETFRNMTVSAATGNRIDNVGGVYQFTVNNPTITPNGFGNITITNGSVSFRGITTADVFCNQSGKPLDSATKMAWSGANGFRLNAATNNASGQAYTFQTGTATNFARLELLNGALYRGGTATIASGGSLIVATGASAIADVAMQPGATLALPINATNDYGKLVVTNTADLGGATLAVSFSAPPEDGFEYVIIRKDSAGPVTGTFASGTLTATFGVREYLLKVNYAGGDGNDVSLACHPRGTLVIFM